MGLQVWLPLNGDLENYGLSNIEITNNGAVANTSGKIGSCYYFNGSSALQFTSPSSTIQSVCFWLKTTKTASRVCFADYNSKLAFGFNANKYVIVSCNGYNIKMYTDTSAIVDDIWTHIILVKKDSDILLYINGILQTARGSANYWTHNTALTVLGARSYSTSAYMTCYMNDLRMYDHALSAKEVEEIARGLVLHYKLDNNGLGGENLAKNTYNLAPFSTGQVEFKAYNVGTLDVEDGETVTISFDLDMTVNKAANSGYLQVYNTNYPGPHQVTAHNVLSGRKLVVGEDIHERMSFTTTFTTRTSGVNRTYDVLEFYSDYSTENEINISNIKIERGTIATPWSPAPSDIGLEENIVYDSSGYGHAATANTITWSSPSPRYSAAAHFNGTDSYIRVPFNEVCPDNIFTVNLWFKKDALGSKGYETLFGGPSGFEMDTRAGNATTLSLYMTSTRGGNVFSSFNLGEWYMVTMVRDGTNELYYVNGELKKTIAAKAMPTGIYRIGAWNSDTGQNYYGEISDFRIYNIPLAANDIIELYNTSVSIDKNGNVYAREVVEV